jgi:hypothetical protein
MAPDEAMRQWVDDARDDSKFFDAGLQRWREV